MSQPEAAANVLPTLHVLAKQCENVGRMVQGIESQTRRFREGGLPEAAMLWTSSQIPELKLIRDRLLRQMGSLMRRTPYGEWVENTHGLGNALYFTLGILPDLASFATVSKAWKYCGLHVENGHARKRSAGQYLGFNARLRSYMIMWVAEPTTKQRKSPYRTVFDRRKAHTTETHPPMLPEGGGCPFCDAAYAHTKAKRAERDLERQRTGVAFDCAALGGIHWSPAHRQADALRVTAKAILRDAWRVAHGLAPKGAICSEEGAAESPLAPERTVTRPLLAAA